MSRWVQLGGNLLLALSSTMAAFLLAEVVSRHVYRVEIAHFVDCQGRPATTLVNDYELEFRMRPNFCGGLQGSEFQNSVRTNSSGFRDTKDFVREKNGALRIFGLGDSYAFGWGVEQDQTYLSLLQKELRDQTGSSVEAFNLGVWGYGTLQEIKVFDLFKDYRPDLVILEFYARDAYIEEWGNDLVDNYHFQQWYESRGEPKQGAGSAASSQAAEVAAVKGFLANDCNLCRIAALELGPYVKGNFHPAGNEARRKAAWQITGNALRDFDNELQSMGIKCVLMWIPPPGTIKARDQSVFDKLNSFAFRNIVVISSLEALSGNPQKYYYSLDAHWRPAAHQVAAQLLLRTILTQRLVSERNAANADSVVNHPAHQPVEN